MHNPWYGGDVWEMAENRINTGFFKVFGDTFRKMVILRIVEQWQVGEGVWWESPTARMSPLRNFLRKKVIVWEL